MIDRRSDFDHYGTLITVLALVLIVTYAQGHYDVSDVVIGIVGITFSVYYFIRIGKGEIKKDIFAILIILAILFISGATLTRSFIEPTYGCFWKGCSHQIKQP